MHACCVLTPANRSQEHLGMYNFIGALMGACLRTNSPLELDLASLVWKPFVGEVCTANDVFAIDEPFAKDVNAMRDINTADAWACKPQTCTWTVRSVSGRVVSLRPDGAHTPVEYADRDEYIAACVAWRMSECSPQVGSCRALFVCDVCGYTDACECVNIFIFICFNVYSYVHAYMYIMHIHK
jgi:hypothetical protein